MRYYRAPRGTRICRVCKLLYRPETQGSGGRHGFCSPHCVWVYQRGHNPDKAPANPPAQLQAAVDPVLDAWIEVKFRQAQAEIRAQRDAGDPRWRVDPYARKPWDIV